MRLLSVFVFSCVVVCRRSQSNYFVRNNKYCRHLAFTGTSLFRQWASCGESPNLIGIVC